MLLEDGNAESAERTLQQATARYPIDPEALLLYASAAERQSHFDTARTALIQFGALISNDPNFAARASRIALLSMRLNEPNIATVWLRQAQAASPNDLSVTLALVEAQLRAGDRAAAQTTIARGLEKAPANTELLDLVRRLK